MTKSVEKGVFFFFGKFGFTIKGSMGLRCGAFPTGVGEEYKFVELLSLSFDASPEEALQLGVKRSGGLVCRWLKRSTTPRMEVGRGNHGTFFRNEPGLFRA